MALKLVVHLPLAPAAISAILSVVTLATAAHTLHTYNNQQKINAWWLPLWPQHFDTRGTQALIGSSVVVALLNLAYIALAIVFSLAKYQPLPNPNLPSLIGLGAAVPSIIVTLFSTIYASVLNSADNRDTLQTWTCQWSAALSPKTKDAVPNDFSRTCTESKFALNGSITVLVLQAVMIVLVAVSMIQNKGASRPVSVSKEVFESMSRDSPSLEERKEPVVNVAQAS